MAAPARLGSGTAAALDCVRETVPVLGDDRALGPEVERLASAALESGELLRRVDGVVAAG
jgi:histidine ammonia-lyase